jgi:hypothetical protein
MGNPWKVAPGGGAGKFEAANAWPNTLYTPLSQLAPTEVGATIPKNDIEVNEVQ